MAQLRVWSRVEAVQRVEFAGQATGVERLRFEEWLLVQVLPRSGASIEAAAVSELLVVERVLEGPEPLPVGES